MIMGETFTIIFKDKSRLSVNYPKDAMNPFKMRKMKKATIDNVFAIEGGGSVAQSLRKRYGLKYEHDEDLTNLQIIMDTSGLTRKNVLKLKKKFAKKLEAMRKKY